MAAPPFQMFHCFRDGWELIKQRITFYQCGMDTLSTECNPLLDELPTVSETVKAIKLLSSGKAPGSDAIPAEFYKAGGSPVAAKLTELFHIMWRKEAIPQEFKDATIIHFFKRKELFCLPSEKRLILKGKNVIPWEQILSFESREHYRRNPVHRKANRKSQNCLRCENAGYSTKCLTSAFRKCL